MCGIVGWRSWNGEKPDRRILKQMNDAIAHRGPDSDGMFIDDGVALAMRRLAIIDLSPKGNQPMTSSTGNSTIVFNGEIYNFQELKQLPELKPYRFHSGADTEVILALYEAFGAACVTYLRGMFAFAIYNHKTKELFLARDRLGKKPLLYANGKGILLFGSELKALLKHPALAVRTIDRDALQLYLQFGYVPAPRSIFQEIKKLPPAHTLTVTKEGVCTIQQYWDVDFNKKTTLTYSQATAKVRALVEESVRLRLMSDVPLGAFLSGGIDSSMVVACMAKASSTAVKTFSVGFDDKKYDELEYARLIAERYNTDHAEITLKPDFLKDMPHIMRYYDEPFSDASSIPTYYIAQATRKHVTVALNGDGGDENFAGYARYVNGMQARLLRIPPIPKSGLPRTGKMRMVELLGMNSKARYYSLHSTFEDHLESSKTLRGETPRKNKHPFDVYYNKPKQLLDKWLYTDIKTYLPGDLLVKVDIATMANSLEGRSPLLDHRLVEFSATLPPEWKLRGKNTKIIFKDAAKDLVPHEILNKRKQGFAVPINEWMHGELGSYAQNELVGKSTVLDMLDRQKIAKLLDLHKQGKPHGYRIWNLLMLREWEKTYGLEE